MEFFLAMKLASSVVLVGVFSWILYSYGNIWYKSQMARRKLQMQGVWGPPPSFLRGNLSDMQKIQSQTNIKKAPTSGHPNDQFLAHDYTATLFPYFEHWRKQYGTILLSFFILLVSSLKWNSVMVDRRWKIINQFRLVSAYCSIISLKWMCV